MENKFDYQNEVIESCRNYVRNYRSNGLFIGASMNLSYTKNGDLEIDIFWNGAELTNKKNIFGKKISPFERDIKKTLGRITMNSEELKSVESLEDPDFYQAIFKKIEKQ